MAMQASSRQHVCGEMPYVDIAVLHCLPFWAAITHVGCI